MLKNSRAFTLIEMLIVMLIISVLLILIIPNLTNRTGNINEKGCDALVSVVQAQADAFYLDTGNRASSIEDLVNEYIESEQTTCPNGVTLTINNGEVSTHR